MKKFYTYAYLDDAGKPYYIGKGHGIRAWKNHANIKTPSRDKILILKAGLTEEQAFLHERYMIAIMGRVIDGSGILHNRTLGGEGIVGWHWSEKDKLRIREQVTGRQWWNNGSKNVHSAQSPGEEWKKGRLVTWDESSRLSKMKEAASVSVYKLTHETGTVAFARNLHELGKQCGHRTGFYRVLQGSRNSYKGWTKVEKINEKDISLNPEMVILMCKKYDDRVYKITHKDGSVITSSNLTKTGEEYGSKDGFLRVLNGLRKSYKGWISVELVKE